MHYDIHYQGDYFGDMGLRLENNSQEEIADAMMEMRARVTGKWHDSDLQLQLQNKFWTSVNNIKYSNIIRNQLRINISSTFLERNSSLI